MRNVVTFPQVLLLVPVSFLLLADTTTGFTIGNKAVVRAFDSGSIQQQGSNNHPDALKTLSIRSTTIQQPSLTTLYSTTSGDVSSSSASSRFSGAGPILVDMDQYNVMDMEQIITEWTAILMPATPLQSEGVYLQAKSKESLLADTVKVSFPRIPGKGLGLQLLELAGGRADGIGITMIEEVLEDGCAVNSGILAGDSITKVELRKKIVSDGNSGLALVESEEAIAFNTECYNYDKTVDVIRSLPPASIGTDPLVVEETFILTLKRLRWKPKVQLKLQYPPAMWNTNNIPADGIITLELFAGENLRRAMLVRNVKLNDPLATRFDSGGTGDCGAEGTCATCAVSVIRGSELLNPPGSTESQIFKNSNNLRWRMACKAVVGYGMRQGELVIRVNPKQWADKL